MEAWKIYLCVIAVISLIAFFLYASDKAKAKRGAWRIPEKVLLLCSFFCGAVGGLLGMLAFRHKTKKPLFLFTNTAALVLHIAATAALAAALALTLWFTGMFDIDVGKTSGVFNNIDSGLSSLCDSISSFGRSLIDALGNFTDLISFERNTDYEE